MTHTSVGIKVGDIFICKDMGIQHTVLMVDSTTVLTEWEGYGIDRNTYCQKIKNKRWWSIDKFGTDFIKDNLRSPIGASDE